MLNSIWDEDSFKVLKDKPKDEELFPSLSPQNTKTVPESFVTSKPITGVTNDTSNVQQEEEEETLSFVQELLNEEASSSIDYAFSGTEFMPKEEEMEEGSVITQEPLQEEEEETLPFVQELLNEEVYGDIDYAFSGTEFIPKEEEKEEFLPFVEDLVEEEKVDDLKYLFGGSTVFQVNEEEEDRSTLAQKKVFYYDTVKQLEEYNIDLNNPEHVSAVGKAMDDNLIEKFESTGEQQFAEHYRILSGFFNHAVVIDEDTYTFTPLSLLFIQSSTAENNKHMIKSLQEIFSNDDKFNKLLSQINNPDARSYLVGVKQLYDSEEKLSSVRNRQEILLSAMTEMATTLASFAISSTPVSILAGITLSLGYGTYRNNKMQEGLATGRELLTLMSAEKRKTVVEQRIRPDFVRDDGTIDYEKIEQVKNDFLSKDSKLVTDMLSYDHLYKIDLNDPFWGGVYSALSGQMLVFPEYGIVYNEASLLGDSIGTIAAQTAKLLFSTTTPTGAAKAALSLGFNFLKEMGYNVSSGKFNEILMGNPTLFREILVDSAFAQKLSIAGVSIPQLVGTLGAGAIGAKTISSALQYGVLQPIMQAAAKNTGTITKFLEQNPKLANAIEGVTNLVKESTLEGKQSVLANNFYNSHTVKIEDVNFDTDTAVTTLKRLGELYGKGDEILQSVKDLDGSIDPTRVQEVIGAFRNMISSEDPVQIYVEKTLDGKTAVMTGKYVDATEAGPVLAKLGIEDIKYDQENNKVFVPLNILHTILKNSMPNKELFEGWKVPVNGKEYTLDELINEISKFTTEVVDVDNYKTAINALLQLDRSYSVGRLVDTRPMYKVLEELVNHKDLQKVKKSAFALYEDLVTKSNILFASKFGTPALSEEQAVKTAPSIVAGNFVSFLTKLKKFDAYLEKHSTKLFKDYPEEANLMLLNTVKGMFRTVNRVVDTISSGSTKLIEFSEEQKQHIQEMRDSITTALTENKGTIPDLIVSYGKYVDYLLEISGYNFKNVLQENIFEDMGLVQPIHKEKGKGADTSLETIGDDLFNTLAYALAEYAGIDPKNTKPEDLFIKALHALGDNADAVIAPVVKQLSTLGRSAVLKVFDGLYKDIPAQAMQNISSLKFLIPVLQISEAEMNLRSVYGTDYILTKLQQLGLDDVLEYTDIKEIVQDAEVSPLVNKVFNDFRKFRELVKAYDSLYSNVSKALSAGDISYDAKLGMFAKILTWLFKKVDRRYFAPFIAISSTLNDSVITKLSNWVGQLESISADNPIRFFTYLMQTKTPKEVKDVLNTFGVELDAYDTVRYMGILSGVDDYVVKDFLIRLNEIGGLTSRIFRGFNAKKTKGGDITSANKELKKFLFSSEEKLRFREDPGYRALKLNYMRKMFDIVKLLKPGSDLEKVFNRALGEGKFNSFTEEGTISKLAQSATEYSLYNIDFEKLYLYIAGEVKKAYVDAIEEGVKRFGNEELKEKLPMYKELYEKVITTHGIEGLIKRMTVTHALYTQLKVRLGYLKDKDSIDVINSGLASIAEGLKNKKEFDNLSLENKAKYLFIRSMLHTNILQAQGVLPGFGSLDKVDFYDEVSKKFSLVRLPQENMEDIMEFLHIFGEDRVPIVKDVNDLREKLSDSIHGIVVHLQSVEKGVDRIQSLERLNDLLNTAVTRLKSVSDNFLSHVFTDSARLHMQKALEGTIEQLQKNVDYLLNGKTKDGVPIRDLIASDDPEVKVAVDKILQSMTLILSKASTHSFTVLLRNLYRKVLENKGVISKQELLEHFYNSFISFTTQRDILDVQKNKLIIEDQLGTLSKNNPFFKKVKNSMTRGFIEVINNPKIISFRRFLFDPLAAYSQEFIELNKGSKLFAENMYARLHLAYKSIIDRENKTKPELLNMFKQFIQTEEGREELAQLLVESAKAYYPEMSKVKFSESGLINKEQAEETVGKFQKTVVALLSSFDEVGKLEEFVDILFELFKFPRILLEANKDTVTAMEEKLTKLVNTENFMDIYKQRLVELGIKNEEEVKAYNAEDLSFLQGFITHDFISMFLTGASMSPEVMGRLRQLAPSWAAAALQLRGVLSQLTSYLIFNGELSVKDILENEYYIPLHYLNAGQNMVRLKDNDFAKHRSLVSLTYYYHTYRQNVMKSLLSSLVEWYDFNRDFLESEDIDAKAAEDLVNGLVKVVAKSFYTRAPFIVRLVYRYLYDIGRGEKEPSLQPRNNKYLQTTRVGSKTLGQLLNTMPLYSKSVVQHVTKVLWEELALKQDSPLAISLIRLVQNPMDTEAFTKFIDALLNHKDLKMVKDWFDAMDTLTGTAEGKQYLSNVIGSLFNDFITGSKSELSSDITDRLFSYANLSDADFIKHESKQIKLTKKVKQQEVATLKVDESFMAQRKNLDASYRDMLWVLSNPFDAIGEVAQKYISIVKFNRYVGNLLQFTNAIRIVTKDDPQSVKEFYTDYKDMYQEVTLYDLLKNEYGAFGRTLAQKLLSSDTFVSKLLHNTGVELIDSIGRKYGKGDIPTSSALEDSLRALIEADKVTAKSAMKLFRELKHTKVYISKAFWDEYVDMAEGFKKVKGQSLESQFIDTVKSVLSTVLSEFRYEYSGSVLILNPVSWIRNLVGAIITPAYALGMGVDFAKYVSRSMKTIMSGGSKGDVDLFLEYKQLSPTIPLSVPRYSLEEFTIPKELKFGSTGTRLAYNVLSGILTGPLKVANRVGFGALTKFLRSSMGEPIAKKMNLSEVDSFHVVARLRTLYGLVDEISKFAVYLAAREGRIKAPEYVRNPALKHLRGKFLKVAPELKPSLDSLVGQTYMTEMTPKEAIRFAEKFSFTYYELPKAWRVMRNIVNPFISFVYNSGKIVYHSFKLYPMRTLAFMSMFSILNEALEDEYGISVSWDTIVPGIDWADALSVMTYPVRGGELPKAYSGISLSAPFAKFAYIALAGVDPWSRRMITQTDSPLEKLLYAYSHSLIPVPPTVDFGTRMALYGLLSATASPQYYDLLSGALEMYLPESWLSTKVLEQGMRGKPIDRYGTKIAPWMALVYVTTGLNLRIEDQMKLTSMIDFYSYKIDRLEKDIQELQSLSPMETSLNLAQEIKNKKDEMEKFKKLLVDAYSRAGIDVPAWLAEYDKPDFLEKLEKEVLGYLFSLIGFEADARVPYYSIGRRGD